MEGLDEDELEGVTEEVLILFECAQRYITVLPARSTYQRLLLGKDDANNRLDEVFEKYGLTMTFNGLYAISIALQISFWYAVPRKEVFLILGGLCLPAVLSLGRSRIPKLLHRVINRFDMVFFTSNLLAWAICLAFEFGWDERAFAMFCTVPVLFVSMTVDACSVEVDHQPMWFFLLAIYLIVAVAVKEMHEPSLVIDFNLGDIFGHDWNTTALQQAGQHEPWHTTSTFYLSSIGSTRACFAIVYILARFVVMLWRPQELSSLRCFARRRIKRIDSDGGQARKSTAYLRRSKVDVQKNADGSKRESGLEQSGMRSPIWKEGTIVSIRNVDGFLGDALNRRRAEVIRYDAEASMYLVQPHSSSKSFSQVSLPAENLMLSSANKAEKKPAKDKNGTRSVKKAVSQSAEQLNRKMKKCQESLTLHKDSEVLLASLDDNDEVIVLVPTREFALDNGTGATLMCKLCRSDVAQARRYLELMEKLAPFAELSIPITMTIAGFGLLDALPPQCTWIIVANLCGILRDLLRCNVLAIKHCMGEVFNFWLPLVSAVIASVVVCASFGAGSNSAGQAFIVIWLLSFVSKVLLNDADCREDRIRFGTETFVVDLFGAFVTIIFSLAFWLGGIPSAWNCDVKFTFFQRTIVSNYHSLFLQFMSTPVLYQLKFLIKSRLNFGKCTSIQLPLKRETMLKKDVPGFVLVAGGNRQHSLTTRAQSWTKEEISELAARAARMHKSSGNLRDTATSSRRSMRTRTLSNETSPASSAETTPRSVSSTPRTPRSPGALARWPPLYRSSLHASPDKNRMKVHPAGGDGPGTGDTIQHNSSSQPHSANSSESEFSDSESDLDSDTESLGKLPSVGPRERSSSRQCSMPTIVSGQSLQSFMSEWRALQEASAVHAAPTPTAAPSPQGSSSAALISPTGLCAAVELPRGS